MTVGAGLVYVRRIEPRWLAVSRIRVPLNRTGQSIVPVRVLQLSDLHLSPEVSLEYIAESIDLGLSTRPDVIVLTGDYFTGPAQTVSEYADVLRRLSAAAPTFACLGNHDGGQWSRARGGLESADAVVNMLGGAGIACLINEGREVRVHGRTIQLIGVGDFWSGLCKPDTAFANVPARGDAVRLLLNHNPDAKVMLRSHDWDLMLCGHTHGGQLRLPLIGAPYAPVRDKRYIHGLHSWENRWLHITSGVGNLHGVRFNCRPEVTVLTLV